MDGEHTEALGRLIESGWFEGRRLEINADRLRDLFEEKGYEFDAAAEEFLSEYGDLIIPFERNGREDAVDLRFERAYALADPEWVGFYSARIGQSVLPVGFANHEHLTILRAGDGAFYVGYDDYLASVGHSPLEMVEGVLMQKYQPVP